MDNLSLVVNFDLPNVPETYVHRIGRTGRAHASGIAISFCDKDERPYLRDIEKLIKQEVPRMLEHPFVEEVQEESRSQRNQGPQKHTNQSRNRNRSGNSNYRGKNSGYRGNSNRNKSRGRD